MSTTLPPMECLYVTEEFLLELKSGNRSFRLPHPVPVLRFLCELSWTLVRGELPFQKCKAALDSVEFVDKMSAVGLGSNFADIITQMAQDLTMSGEYRSRLIKLAKWLVESALVPLRFFQERCEEEFLWEAEMIKIKAQDLKGKEVRVNTRLLYQQTKFNLLREESEGYAKLVTLLCRGSEDTAENTSAATIGIIKSLIGHFDLDPNRVFDIVLECFELQPDSNVFLELIPIFPKSHASQILGFKFQYYQRMELNSPVPFGLYKLTALLVREEFIDLDSICAHLLPKDHEAFEHYNIFSSKRLDEAYKIGKINLAATGKDLMDDEKQGDVTIDLFAALDMETEAVAERFSDLEKNQTLGLLTGFLSVDDWYHAHILFERLSPLNPVAHTQICDGLFRLIEKTISSAYNIIRQPHVQNCGSPAVAGIDAMDVTSSSGHVSLIDLPKEFFQMLVTVGPYLYRDTLLLQKVCRVLRGYYMSALELVDSGDGALNGESLITRNRVLRLHLREGRSMVEEALGACLLPSLQLVPANPAAGQEIWEVMSLLPYEVRYRLYGEWEKDDERNPMVLAARQTAKLDTRRILKRLAKENLKQLGRMVAKLAHANPMTVLRTIVHQIEAYRDMITPVVDAFKYLTQLEYDILEYVVIERLAQGGRDKLKDDGLNLSDWLQSLASFWGHLCKKYPSMELRGLFQYLVNQLKKGQGIELVLLQVCQGNPGCPGLRVWWELVQQMANVQYTENLTEEQLDAMAGSETLRYQATSFGVTRNNKALFKSTNRLRDSLLPKDEPKLAIPLLLLIAQHRSVVVINADAPYIKMLIPSLDDLVHLYHLDPETSNETVITTTSANLEPEAREYSGRVILDLGSLHKPVMWSDLLETVKTMLPSKAWNSLSPDLYATFWGLTLYDLYVPRNRYESEIAKQQAALKALEELSIILVQQLLKGRKRRKGFKNLSIVRLVSSINMKKIMPDAVYCAMFVHTLHSLGTPFFNTSDETIYERECGNMPGFAVYYRFPNSQRVTYGQFIKVHWKWSQRMSRLLIQCLESSEYMEIRNALILLTKISGVFPVTKRSGINLEKRVTRIKSDEREDLKVLATGVAAALAARKPSWVTDEEFGMGYLDIKPPSAASKSLSGNVAAAQNSSALNVSQGEPADGRALVTGSQHGDPGNSNRDQVSRAKHADGRSDRTENTPHLKSDLGHQKSKGGSSANGSNAQSAVSSAAVHIGASRSAENQKGMDDSTNRTLEDSTVRVAGKNLVESEFPQSGQCLKHQSKMLLKDDNKSGKGVGRTLSSSTSDKDIQCLKKSLTMFTRTSDSYGVESKPDSGGNKPMLKDEATEVADVQKPPSRLVHSPSMITLSKDKGNDRYDRDHRERSERPDKSRGDDSLADRSRDKSMERYGREHSVERGQDRVADRSFDRLADKAKDDRSKLRYNDTSAEKSQVDDRFHGQNLPPPPPLPPHMVPQSVTSGRRDEDADRRMIAKRRKEDDVRERKREEREGLSIKGKLVNILLFAPPPPPLGIGMSHSYEGRGRGDRKGAMNQHASYLEEPLMRIHGDAYTHAISLALEKALKLDCGHISSEFDVFIRPRHATFFVNVKAFVTLRKSMKRTGINEVTILPDPGKPLPGDVLKTLLHALEFERKLSGLCIKTEGDLPLSESKINVLPTVTFTPDGENLAEHENVNSDNANEEFLKSSAEQDTIQSSAQGSVCEETDATPMEMKDSCLKLSSEIIGTVDPKVADEEALGLLRWLATSQAAEDINSDDELICDTILSPLLPAATIDKVLEKANIDYETESQKECQDILDSIEDLVNFEDFKEKASHSVDHSPQTSLEKKFPSLILCVHLLMDPLEVHLRWSQKVNVKGIHRIRYYRLLTAASSNKQKRNRSLWCSLPFSINQKANDDPQVARSKVVDLHVDESKNYAGTVCYWK
ncbi:THO complex subunit 2-like isoform X1 [Populus alba x Populus x berolinensis]|uniref:THO complex subunit 2 n=1 Tax=Populus alba x Populus x berolinensis TaxID=444605 RepID=A0AAD6LWG7_9ROSI|nr:THO complex subunit 2-like isoform X1 [Populus alba x Populus x berolinensis]